MSDLSQEEGDGGVGVTSESEGELGRGAQCNQPKLQTGAIHTHLWTL